MVRFEKLQIPETIYPYADVVTAAEYINGIFGTVSSGTFTKGAGNYCLMQVEWGDKAHSDEFTVPAGAHARVADMTKGEGLIINITANELPSTYDVGDILAAASTGLLAVDSSSGAKGYEIVEITDYGVRAKVALA